jgi:hypothetical protein
MGKAIRLKRVVPCAISVWEGAEHNNFSFSIIVLLWVLCFRDSGFSLVLPCPA